MQRRTSRLLRAGTIALAAALALGACSKGSGFTSTPSASGGKLTDDSGALTVLIASSGTAETNAVKAAATAFTKQSGVEVKVQNASNLPQQMAQGFASGTPADVFYTGTGQLAGWAKNGSLLAYGDMLGNKNDYYPTLKSSFTYNGKFMCAPKDFSTLALFINTADWQAAGLTDADIPTTWDQLATVSKKLTEDGRVGLTMSPQWERVGAFMAEAGGSLTNADETTATVNSAANVKALEYVQSLLKSGSTKFSSDLGEGWGGDAFGKNKAAMTVEGNWLTGAMSSTYPSVKYKVVPMPDGPAGPGTLQFTNCWGIASQSKKQENALKLVEFLTSADQQLKFSQAFGVMPTLTSTAAEWKKQYPQFAAFIDQANDAQGVPTKAGTADVITAFDQKMGSLATQNVTTLLDGVQKNMAAALKQ